MAAAALAAATYVAFHEDRVSPAPPEVGIGHVHGLGVNPRDGGVILATHSGLWRTPAGAVRPFRVGDSLRDTMGLTVVGPDHFLASGHPDPHEDLPPLLGLIESRDAGRSWSPVSRLGESDFHTLRSHGQLVYGLDGVSGMVFASEDRGRTWTRHVPPSPLVDLVIDPDDSSHLVASGGAGIFESNDRGRTWSPVAPHTAGFLAWPSSDRLFLLDGAGHLSVTTDRAAGRSWRTVGSVGDEPEAFLAAGGKLYVALHHGVVKESADGGVTWSVRSRS